MLTQFAKQEIIIRDFRDGHSERKIARELPVSRKTVHSYFEEYRKARDKLTSQKVDEEALIVDLRNLLLDQLDTFNPVLKDHIEDIDAR
jgi:hypothetical protein